MRNAILLLVAALAAVMAVACEPQEVRQSPEKPPAGGAGAGGKAAEPLLLDGGENRPAAPAGPVADNSRCFVCHLNYMQEEIAVVHAWVNIGCVGCHGNCDAHIADESWASGGNGTPPGVMYPREKINLFCMGCHPKDKMPAAFLAGTAREKYCTDCHGKHRLAQRKCKWK